MEEVGLVGDLAAVAIAALIGGTIARLLRLPAILGYLGAGVVIGPNSPGPASDVEAVQTVADLGVALLMFTLGIRFSLRELNSVRSLAIGGGLLQIGLLIGVAFGFALLIGLEADEAVVIGMAVSSSSSMVALRLLEERGVIEAPAGRVGIVFALAQDILVIPMIVAIPVIAGHDDNPLEALAISGLKAAGLLTGVWLAGVYGLPWLFSRVTIARSRELFLLMVVALALGTATLSFEAGLSVAFGAFLAGILISESEYAHKTLAEVFPLREIFAVVFFVSIGMLIDPESFLESPDIVFGFASIAVVVKGAVIIGIALAFGYSMRSASTAGVALGNMGEFSFVLLSVGVAEGVIGRSLNEAVLGAVMISLAVTPLLFALQGQLLPQLARIRFPLVSPSPVAESPTLAAAMVNHAIIAGYNQAAEEIGLALAARNFRYVVIDEDPVEVRRLRAHGVVCILGDPSQPNVLEAADVKRAKVVAVVVADVRQGEAVVSAAREINPRVDVIARGSDEMSHHRLTQSGASEVVHAEVEVGLEFARHTLHRFGLSSQEIQAYVAGRRRRWADHSPLDRP